MSKLKKPKILYVITQGTWGGAQRYVFDLVVNLAKNYDISIAIGEPTGKKDLQKKIKDSGLKIDIIQLKHLVRKISPTHDILAIFELQKLYKTLRPDIIHLNSSKAGIVGSLAKSKVISFQPALPKHQQGRSLVFYTVHGWVFNEPVSWLRKTLYKILEKFTSYLKNKIIVLSEQDKKTAIDELGIKPDKIKIIPLGIELSKEALSKEKAREKIINKINIINNGRNISPPISRDVWIGTIAGLYKTKGLDILIKAAYQLKNQQSKFKNLQFIIIGDGPEKNNIQLLIAKYQLTNIHLLGFAENASQYLPAFDLFILPSRKEGLPYTILEAIQAKIPVITTRVGGIPNVINNKKTGILIEPDNVGMLSDATADAIKEKKSFFQNLNLEPKFNLKNMVQNTSLVYQEFLQEE